MRGYKEGMEHFHRQEYADAVDCFEHGTGLGHSSECAMMLGKCHEHGLGTSKDLVLAKDNYRMALIQFGFMHSPDCEEILWLKAKLEELKDLPEINEQSFHSDRIGPVSVKRTKIKDWSVRYNERGTQVDISYCTPLCRGFKIAESRNLRENVHWTCDGYSRFFDGYTLDAELFRLEIRRGSTNEWKEILDGRHCTIIFGKDADLDYLYVQEAILAKARTLLKKRAKVIFTEILDEMSEMTGVPYRKCKVSEKLSKSWAYRMTKTGDITFSLKAIMLPLDNFKALCVHELTHYFVSDHNRSFYLKLEELGGKHLAYLDARLDSGMNWRQLKL